MFRLVVFCLLALTVVSANECSKSVYEKIGCFKRQHKFLPDLIVNDRDPTHKNYSGKKVDWVNYARYLDDLACRCSDKAKQLGYKFFGLGFYGECWAGRDMNLYKKVTEDFSQGSMGCIDGEYWACEQFAYTPCIGGSNTEYLYLVVGDDEEEGGEE